MQFVPSEFVKKYMWSCSKFIKIQDSSSKQWSVTCDFYDSSTSSKRISKGSRTFFVDNDLKEGDVCVFELIMNNKDVLLKVWIYNGDDEEETIFVNDNDDDDDDIEILDSKARPLKRVNKNMSKGKLRESEMPHEPDLLIKEDESNRFLVTDLCIL